MRTKADLLENLETCNHMNDFIVNEVNVADELYNTFGFEEEDILECYKKHSRIG